MKTSDELHKQQAEYDKIPITRVNISYNDILNRVGLELRAKFSDSGENKIPVNRPYSTDGFDLWVYDKIENKPIEQCACHNLEAYIHSCKSLAEQYLKQAGIELKTIIYEILNKGK